MPNQHDCALIDENQTVISQQSWRYHSVNKRIMTTPMSRPDKLSTVAMEVPMRPLFGQRSGCRLLNFNHSSIDPTQRPGKRAFLKYNKKERSKTTSVEAAAGPHLFLFGLRLFHRYLALPFTNDFVSNSPTTTSTFILNTQILFALG